MTLLTMLALVPASAHAAEAAVQRYALLIGANDGGKGRVVLQYADDDARTMADVLTRLGGVAPERRQILMDPDAEDLTQALGQLSGSLDAANGRAEVIFYYSGHSDETGLLLGEDHLSYRELRERLEGLSADVRVAILDSCASGAMVRSKGGRRVAPFMVDESNQLDGFAIITSSAADEVAQEADSVGGSYFTHYLATGLRGAADLSQDGRVTLDEAYAFAHAETLARTERTQYGPQHANRGGGLDGQGHLVLTDLQLTTASLVLAEALGGRALIRDNDGDLVAELLKPAGRAVELGLGAGEYDVVFTDPGTDRYAVARVTLVTGSSVLLETSDLTWYDSETAVARGVEPAQAVLVPNPRRKRSLLRIQLAPGVLPTPADSVDTTLIGLAAAHSRQLDGLAVAMGGLFVDREAKGLMATLGVNTAGELRGTQASLGANVVGGQARGLQATLGANVAGGHLNGGQVALGGNVAGRGVRGLQGSLGVNVAGGDVNGLQGTLGANVGNRVQGLQGSLGANIATELNGIQATLGANIASRTVTGLQASLGANIAAGDVRGIQGTLGANFGRDVVGLQATVGANIARSVRGVQTGTVNIGKEVDGAQIGLVNIGGTVRGAQIGLVNIAREVKGVNIGLLNFEKEGRHDLLIYASESDLANLEFKLGGSYLHTTFGAGFSPNQHGWVGIGVGGHIPMGHTWWLDIDAIAQSYAPIATFSQPVDGIQTQFSPFDSVTQVGRARITLGAQLAKNLGLFAGVQFAGRYSVWQSKNLDLVPGFLAPGDQEILFWPGAFAGVKF